MLVEKHRSLVTDLRCLLYCNDHNSSFIMSLIHSLISTQPLRDSSLMLSNNRFTYVCQLTCSLTLIGFWNIEMI